MERKERICSVCGKKYKFCPHCQEDSHKPMWFYSFCSYECHDIYNIASQFENGTIDIESANNKLNKLDISKVDDRTSYKKTIAKIMNTEKVVAEEKVITEKPAVKTVENNVEEEKSIKKPRTKKAKDVE